jgi:site-specific DNA recombinase
MHSCGRGSKWANYVNAPALDQLLTDARRRRFDVLVVWRLDRLGRNLRHLIILLEELAALGIAFVSFRTFASD